MKVFNFLKSLSPTTWIIIAIVIVLLIAAIIYLSSKSKDEAEGSSANKDLQGNLTSAQPRSNFPLSYGSKGLEVKALQSYLNSKGETLVVDGIWGPLTDTAVMKVIKVSSISKELFSTLK